MSRRLPRTLVTSGAAALALLLAAPTAALAEDGGKGADNGKKGEHGTSSQAGSKDAKGSGSKGDPAGNNGTIKIDYAAPADSGHANRPHPGCAFQLRMFNFDDDQYGSITFVGQAPTKLGTLLTQSHVLLSDDAAGGGQDVDAVYSYTAQQLGLLGKPQAKQGWHVKVSVDAENAPGGAKHKVFWLKCETAPATTGGTSSGGASTSETSTKSTSTSGGTATAQSAGALNTTILEDVTGTTAGAATVGTNSLSGSSAGAATAAAAANRGTVSARGFGTALPFTGLALGTMVALALGALAAGALAIRAGRRRTAADL